MCWRARKVFHSGSLKLRSTLEPKNKLEARPNLIHSTNLGINQAGGQSDCLNVDEGKLGGHSRALLRPGDPKHARRLEPVSVPGKTFLQFRFTPNEQQNKVEWLLRS